MRSRRDSLCCQGQDFALMYRAEHDQPRRKNEITVLGKTHLFSKMDRAKITGISFQNMSTLIYTAVMRGRLFAVLPPEWKIGVARPHRIILTP